MPLVQKTWGPLGLKTWKVAKYASADSPYSVQAWLDTRAASPDGTAG